MIRSRLFLLFLLVYFAVHGTLSAQSGADPGKNSPLTEEQKAQLNEICTNWKKKEFMAFLKRQKIKLSCAHCERIKVLVEFQVLEEHAHFKITSAEKCGENFSKKQLDEIELLLMKISFPASFKGQVFSWDFGNALKC
ncbi:MAG: hypothetical protein ACJ76F_01690 [Bacteroidia bacterium]